MTVSHLSKSLIGSWALAQWITDTRDNDGAVIKTHAPFGSDPIGLLIYSPDGFVSATVCRSDRQLLRPSLSPRQQTHEAQAEAFKSFFHYAGRWKIEDGQVLHQVSLALNPNLVGTVQVRSPSFNGRNLTLEGIEPMANQSRRHVIQWTKADSDNILGHPGGTT